MKKIFQFIFIISLIYCGGPKLKTNMMHSSFDIPEEYIFEDDENSDSHPPNSNYLSFLKEKNNETQNQIRSIESQLKLNTNVDISTLSDLSSLCKKNLTLKTAQIVFEEENIEFIDYSTESPNIKNLKSGLLNQEKELAKLEKERKSALLDYNSDIFDITHKVLNQRKKVVDTEFEISGEEIISQIDNPDFYNYQDIGEVSNIKGVIINDGILYFLIDETQKSGTDLCYIIELLQLFRKKLYNELIFTYSVDEVNTNKETFVMKGELYPKELRDCSYCSEALKNGDDYLKKNLNDLFFIGYAARRLDSSTGNVISIPNSSSSLQKIRIKPRNIYASMDSNYFYIDNVDLDIEYDIIDSDTKTILDKDVFQQLYLNQLKDEIIPDIIRKDPDHPFTNVKKVIEAQHIAKFIIQNHANCLDENFLNKYYYHFYKKRLPEEILLSIPLAKYKAKCWINSINNKQEITSKFECLGKSVYYHLSKKLDPNGNTVLDFKKYNDCPNEIAGSIMIEEEFISDPLDAGGIVLNNNINYSKCKNDVDSWLTPLKEGIYTALNTIQSYGIHMHKRHNNTCIGLVESVIGNVEDYKIFQNTLYSGLDPEYDIYRKTGYYTGNVVQLISLAGVLKKGGIKLFQFYNAKIALKKAGKVKYHIPNGPMKGKSIKHTFTKHGSHNTHQLKMQAKNSKMPQGQWINDVKAEKFIADNLGKLKNGPVTVELPKGLGRVINPDGTFSTATHVRLVPSSSGVKTAYPIIK